MLRSSQHPQYRYPAHQPKWGIQPRQVKPAQTIFFGCPDIQPSVFPIPSNPTPRQLRYLQMNVPFRGGMQVHAVPDDERAMDSNGKLLPWGYVYADSNLNRKQQPIEKGPFGKTTARRTLSRSKTATPATKDDLIRLENQRVQDEVFGKLKAEMAQSEKQKQSRVITAPSRDNAPQRSLGQDFAGSAAPLMNKSDTDGIPQQATFSEPTEILLYGYLPAFLPDVITFFETAAFGIIYEDYERAPLRNQNLRYAASGLMNPAAARARTPEHLSSEALAKINTFKGGRHWIRVTFDSPLSAQRAMSASPHVISGCEVHAVPWTGSGPADDAFIPAGRAGAAGSLTAGARRAPSSRGQQQGERNFNSFPARMHGTPGGAFADSTSSTETAGGTSSTTVAGNASDSATSDSTLRATSPDNTLRHREPFADSAADKPAASVVGTRRQPRVRGAKLMVIHPVEETFLPVEPWPVRTFGHLPLVGAIVVALSGPSQAQQRQQSAGGGMIGSVVPRTDNGDFDWAHATLWWVVCWYIDFWFGTDICGLRGDD